MDNNRRKAVKCYSFLLEMKKDWERYSETMLTEGGKRGALRSAWAFDFSADHIKRMFNLSEDEINEVNGTTETTTNAELPTS